MRLLTTKYGSSVVLILLLSCVEPYNPKVDNRDLNLLVVDAFLNAATDSATVALTRTLPVESDEIVPNETGAFVRIEDDQGSVYQLQEKGGGIYSGRVDGVTSSRQYRVRITAGGDDYASDLVTVAQTPPIDSITYEFLPDGVQFYVTTHDPTNQSRYYRWEYDETFEYNSEFFSYYMFQGDVIVPRPAELTRHTCWKSDYSTDILVGTTKHLKESVINKFPIAFIPNGSIKLTVEYSILLRQQAITEAAYEYWSRLRKTTEQVGGLFDPLPSEVPGNIHSISDPGENVLGFFSIGSVQQMRKFVRRSELPRDAIRRFLAHDASCVLDTIKIEDIPNYSKSAWLVDAIFSPGGFISGYTTAVTRCIDCTLRGGATAKPDFWK
ncbi:MAG TPA: DUF4249 domain-containing protein [Chryseosolibacter sp.]|nr:DUF4249 domain-containing protein [Chryseosolibacter sp.]